YGADAVAGVVNIKRWKDYRGAEAKFEYGNTTDKDSGSINTALTFGVGDGNTNVSGTVNYYHLNSIFNHDRDYSAVPPFLSSNASPYNLQVTNAAVAEAGGTVIPSGSGNQFASAPNGTNGLAPASQDRARTALTSMNSLSRFRRPSATAVTSRWTTRSLAMNSSSTPTECI